MQILRFVIEVLNHTNEVHSDALVVNGFVVLQVDSTFASDAFLILKEYHKSNFSRP